MNECAHRAGCRPVRDSTLAACYRALYAPRTGGAYDSHHRMEGIAGRARRRGGGTAARGACAAARARAVQSACLCRTRKTIRSTLRIAALLQELELLGWTAGRNVEIDVRLAGRAAAAGKNNSLRPERPHPAAQARSVM